MRTLTALLLFCIFSGLESPAQAYIGPGLGAGTIGVILGIITSILLAIVALVWYPFKRIIKKFRNFRNVEKTKNCNNQDQHKDDDINQAL